jgi:hypothetical protein
MFLFGGVSAIESSVSWVDVSVLVEITNLLGMKLAENLRIESIRFDVNAKLEEKERQSGKVVILFGLTVRTKPSVAKYEVEGNAVLIGKDELINKMLEVDPKSKIPFVFHRVYQHVFTAIYMLASLLGTIYPPPDLLFSSKQGIPVQSLQRVKQVEITPASRTLETADVTGQTKAKEGSEETESVKPAETVKREEATLQQAET